MEEHKIQTGLALARIAERAKAHRDVIRILEKIARDCNIDLTSDMKDMFTNHCKEIITVQRDACDTIKNIMNNEDEYKNYALEIAQYRYRIVMELEANCNWIIAIIKAELYSRAKDDDAKVFYLKMMGDYYRYASEYLEGDKLEKVTEGALMYYHQANKTAK